MSENALQLPGSIRQMRSLVSDLYPRSQLVYWVDFLLSITIGLGFAVVYTHPQAPIGWKVAGFIIGGLGIFRAVNFMHELVHMRAGEMRTFRVAWDLLCGIPSMTPAFFYEEHLEHHRIDRYGTANDGEYLPLALQPVRHIFLFLGQVLVLPVFVYCRFLFTPISFLHPRLRQWTLEHWSAFVINFRHRREVPPDAPRKTWAALDVACFVRALLLPGLVLTGPFTWIYIPQIYLLAVFILSMNHARALVAHRYRNDGRQLSHHEQLEDSITITGSPLLTELFFPLGLRYHALHHVFPAIPYHNLGVAHRRLMAALPADSPYARTVFRSYWSAVRQLWSDARQPHDGEQLIGRVEPQPAAASPATDWRVKQAG